MHGSVSLATVPDACRAIRSAWHPHEEQADKLLAAVKGTEARPLGTVDGPILHILSDPPNDKSYHSG